MIILVMGVTGAGKTTIGSLLAQQLDWEFVDADSFHSPENVEKIRQGIALSDADRAPWLRAIRDAILKWIAERKNVVLACSALKREYREERVVGPEVKVVYLKGSFELISSRLRARHGHFAPEKLLGSQVEAWEEPVDAVSVAVSGGSVGVAAVMVVWGAISSAMVLISGPRSFYALRFLLGAAEAGFFPGMILYLKNWFPARARARAVALFMTAGPIAGVVGGPISGALLGLHSQHISGWQWLFLIEGLPAVLLGIVVLVFLTDYPEAADWLNDEERACLIEILKSEQEPPSRNAALAEVFSAFSNWKIWLLIIVYFGATTCAYGLSLWLPNLIHNVSKAGNFGIGLLSTIPYIATAVAMVLVGVHSDRTGERRWHLALSAFGGAIGLWCAAFATSTLPQIVFLSLALLSAFSMMGPFWATSTSLLSGTAAAAGIALINSFGNLGGFFGPYVIGVVRNATGDFRGGLVIAGAMLAVSGGVAIAVSEISPAEKHMSKA